MHDFLIVGGGVVGLSLAYELAGQGGRVQVLDAREPGKEASWAGAGIMPPGPREPQTPLERLLAISNEMHPRWAAQLEQETGIDNGYRKCGALYLARDPDARETLDECAAFWIGRGIRCDSLTPSDVRRLEPAIKPPEQPAYLLPDEYQIRNPRHLQALIAGCVVRGVELVPGAAATEFELRGDRVGAVETAKGKFAARTVCVTTGSWTAELLQRLGVTLAIKPIRGQIALLRTERPVLSRIVNQGRRYLVPRPDGRLLVGSTEEDVGFDRSNTEEVIDQLLAYARTTVPELVGLVPEQTWAGLRPHSADDLPYLGRVPGFENLYVAAGHYRSGLQLSPATAAVMSQLMRGEEPLVDLSEFRPDRHAACASHQG